MSRPLSNLAAVGASLALIALAVFTRLAGLGMPASRDFDEGVYWQSLRAMDAGYDLYRDIFSSQPPAFLMSMHAVYSMLGHSLWSARFAVAAASLLGIAGFGLLGYGIAGRRGLVVATLLATADAWYLSASRTLQADGPAIAFASLAVGIAYFGRVRSSSDGSRAGLAAAAGAALAIAVLTKFLALPAAIPVVWLLAARADRRIDVGALAGGVAGFAVTCAAFLAPFVGTWPRLYDDVVRFHEIAGNDRLSLLFGSQYVALMRDRLLSPLGVAALGGLAIAAARRDPRILIMLAWLTATLAALEQVSPLFPHHLIALDAPLIALALFAVPPALNGAARASVLSAAGYAIVSCAAIFSSIEVVLYFHAEKSILATSLVAAPARDLRRAIGPAKRVITDEPFIAGLANRDTPPGLVDPSYVRIATGYLTVRALDRAEADGRTAAVLFFSGRLMSPRVASFRARVRHDFTLFKKYRRNQELWIKRSGH